MIVCNFRKSLLATTALTSTAFVAWATGALANPEGGQVVEGQATIVEQDPATLVIDQQSDRAVIDWNTFNIDSGETTRFDQPTTDSWTLNRVTGSNDPSVIQGNLQANGNVAIVNPDGILFSRSARVDVNSLIATTANITNDDFMAGNLQFNIPGSLSASVVNEGEISIGDYGLGAFVAPGVRNSGVVTARFGSLSFGSANTFTLDLYGDGLINLAIDDEITEEVIDVATGLPMADLVKNDGVIVNNGGTVVLKAATARRAVNSVINNAGVIEANSVGVQNGKIILRAQTAGTKVRHAPVQRVQVAGTLRASGVIDTSLRPGVRPTGGHIEITGEEIVLAGATLDASGTYGGGTILVGGDYLGGTSTPEVALSFSFELEEEEVATATNVFADAETTISASALEEGDGGKVIVWSDKSTRTAARIDARGGTEEGDGGFVETSGRNHLVVTGTVDASAVNGNAGTWLLDPTADVYIVSSTNDSLPLIGGVFEPDQSPSYIASNVLNFALNRGTDVTIQTFNGRDVGGGSIHVQSDVIKSSGGDATLNLFANTGLYLTSGHSIRSTSGKLHVNVDADYDNKNGGFIDINSFNRYAIQTNGGNVDMRAWDYRIRGRAIKTSGGDVKLRHINSDATWITIANPIGSDFIIDAQTGNVMLDTKLSDSDEHEHDRIEFGNYAIRANTLTIEASRITNVGEGFDYSNSEYSYKTPAFNSDDGTGELNYRTLVTRGGADENQIDGRVISDEELVLLQGQELTNPDDSGRFDDNSEVDQVIESVSNDRSFDQALLSDNVIADNIQQILADKFGSSRNIAITGAEALVAEFIGSFIKQFWRGGYLTAHLSKPAFYQKVWRHLSSTQDMSRYVHRNAGTYSSFAKGFAAGIALDIVTGIAEDMLNEIGGGNALFKVGDVYVPADAVVQPLKIAIIWNTPALGGPIGASIDQTSYLGKQVWDIGKVSTEIYYSDIRGDLHPAEMEAIERLEILWAMREEGNYFGRPLTDENVDKLNRDIASDTLLLKEIKELRNSWVLRGGESIGEKLDGVLEVLDWIF